MIRLCKICLLLSLLIFFLAPARADNTACGADSAGKFDRFFNRFIKDAEFAKRRTQYPLRVTLIQSGDSPVSETAISMEEDAASPPLSQLMEHKGLTFGGVKLSKTAAIVRVFSVSPPVNMDYLFVRRDGCWVLKEIEDRAELTSRPGEGR